MEDYEVSFTVRPPFRRIARLVGYVLMMAFGVAIVAFPTPLVQGLLTVSIWLFSACLVIGGLLSAISQIKRWYWGEIAGMPALFAAMSFYAFESFASIDKAHLNRMGFGFACVAITLILFARWQDVRFVQKLADLVAEEEAKQDRSEEPGE